MARRTKLKNNIVRGDTPLLRFPLTVNGSAADLTGYTGTVSITASENPPEGELPVIKVENIPGDITGILDAQLLNGVTGNDTSQLTPGSTYYGDLQLSNEQANPALRVFTVLRFQFGVDADNTWSTS